MELVSTRGSPLSVAVSLPGPAGALEGVLEQPVDQEPAAIAVICHPHPLHGGTLHNKVAFTLARVLLRGGAAALRFNFRGVGASEGRHAAGPGEIEDAAAAVGWLSDRWPGRPLMLAGFSFGAMVALGCAQAKEPAMLVTVAPPVLRVPATVRRPECPWLIVQGDQDEVVAAAEVEAWQAGFEPLPEFVLMPGVGHFFDGQLTALGSVVGSFLERSSPQRE